MMPDEILDPISILHNSVVSLASAYAASKARVAELEKAMLDQAAYIESLFGQGGSTGGVVG